MVPGTQEKMAQQGPHIAVIAAFYKPRLAAAARQLSSLTSQTDVRVSIFAVLDGEETSNDPELRQLLVQYDCRLVMLPHQRGIRMAFAAGLEAALVRHPQNSCLFAYCDQDDVWEPAKLSRTSGALTTPGVALAHCDARITDEAGNLIAPSLHRFESRREPNDLLGMLLLNTVTGMTAVFTRAVAEVAVRLCGKFEGAMLHDHITAIAAASLGRVVCVDEPLADYVQHGANQIGARPHIVWRSRALGIGHISAYRHSSAVMFHERRGAALLLAALGLLPWNLRAMFVTDARPNILALIAGCDAAMIKLLLTGDGRRAMLALRMLDAGFFFLLGGGHRRPPPVFPEEIIP